MKNPSKKRKKEKKAKKEAQAAEVRTMHGACRARLLPWPYYAPSKHASLSLQQATSHEADMEPEEAAPPAVGSLLDSAARACLRLCKTWLTTSHQLP